MSRNRFSNSMSFHYHYDSRNRIAPNDRSSSGTVTRARGQTWASHLGEPMREAGREGGLLALSFQDGGNRLNSRNLYSYDEDGTVCQDLNTSHRLAKAYHYDALGRTIADKGELAKQGHRLRFSTKPRDYDTGLYYYGYRYYDPVTGRWPSRDPIEERGGFNLYGFVGNTSINSWDLLGLEGVACVGCHGNASGSWANIASGLQNPANWWQANATAAHPPATYTEAGVGLGYLAAGFQTVHCCDEDDDLKIMVFWKGCFGKGVSADVSVGGVTNFSGEDCDASRYEGLFLEFTAGNGVVGGYDRGLDRSGNHTHVDDLGIGLGGGRSVFLCEYKLICEYTIKKSCSNENMNHGVVPKEEIPSFSETLDLLRVGSRPSWIYFDIATEEDEECDEKNSIAP